MPRIGLLLGSRNQIVLTQYSNRRSLRLPSTIGGSISLMEVEIMQQADIGTLIEAPYKGTSGGLEEEVTR